MDPLIDHETATTVFDTELQRLVELVAVHHSLVKLSVHGNHPDRLRRFGGIVAVAATTGDQADDKYQGQQKTG
jgi:hypothetical protein